MLGDHLMLGDDKPVANGGGGGKSPSSANPPEPGRKAA